MPFYPYKEGRLEGILWPRAPSGSDCSGGHHHRVGELMETLTRLGVQIVARLFNRGSFRETHTAIAACEKERQRQTTVNQTLQGRRSPSPGKRVTFRL